MTHTKTAKESLALVKILETQQPVAYIVPTGADPRIVEYFKLASGHPAGNRSKLNGLLWEIAGDPDLLRLTQDIEGDRARRAREHRRWIDHAKALAAQQQRDVLIGRDAVRRSDRRRARAA